MKRHPITDHELGDDAPLQAPLEPFEAGANREHVLRLIVADADHCERHVDELLRLASANIGTATLALGLAMNRVHREFGVIAIPVLRNRIPPLSLVFDNLTAAAEAGDSPGEAMRNTLGAMAIPVRRRIVAAAIAIINVPSFDYLLR
jgi:hypothetical protein